MSEMRASQSTSESVIKPRQNSGVNTEDSSSSAAYVPKDDLTSGSGNLTPRLEPEMSWDPFSPAPVFPVGFFSGLVDTIEKLDEETEDEVREANSSSPVSPVVKSRTPDMPPALEESVSNGDEEASFGDTLHVEPLVSLTRKSDLTTGEENEEVLFKERAKLYRLHEGQWKERGMGDIKILLDKKTSKARILMRREKVLKVCANHLLIAEMQLTEKVENPNTYVWCTPADLSETEPVTETFAVRFKTAESGNEFSKVFTKYKNIEPSGKKEVSNMQSPEEKEESKVSLGDNDEKEQNAVSAAPFFDFTRFSQKSAEESGAAQAVIKVSSDVIQQKDEKSCTENVAESVDGKGSFQSAGFVFDAGKFNFNAPKAQVVSDNSQNFSPDRNPFLNAIQNLSSSRISPFAFGRFEGANGIESSSPIGSAQTQVSTPSASNLFQRTTFGLAESTPNSDAFASPIAETGFGTEPHVQEYQVNDYLNATAQGSSFINNRVSDQAGYYQSEWESIQDRYYDAAYDDHNGYYDGSSFYQNDDYQNDGEYYTAEDIYYGDEGAYYSNSEQGFEYYDQEPPRDIPPADSDANSDRLSQTEGALSSEELVPHVVQMIDDDIFVTYVKKASFSQRARASRLQLPPNFFAPSSYSPCPGYHLRGKEEENTTEYHRVTPVFAQDLVKLEQRPPVFGATANADSAKDTKGQQFLSFADLVKSPGTFTSRNQTLNSSFSGAGSMLFTAKEEHVESEFDPTFKPIVELKRKEDLKTGEEGYEDLFKNRAKLFRFDFESKQWKERGIGEMRLSHNPETSYCRVIMRRDQVLKLCANHPVMPDIELKPHGMSSTSWVWVSGADYSEGEPQMQQFAVKFKSKEIADEFQRVFQDCQKRIVKHLDEVHSKKSQDCNASPEAQLSGAPIVSLSRNDTPEEELVIIYVKEPSVSEEERASRLLLPKTFFSPSSVLPCPGGSGFHMNAREKINRTTDQSVVSKEESMQEERKTSFLSFADLASSNSGNAVAFQSHERGFFAAGTALFTSPKQDEDPNAFDPTFKPIVQLKRKEDLKTGEEDYEDLFKNRAKLFRFDFESKQWKERGIGEMRLSHNPETSYCRVIMRRDQVLKLCANHPVMPDIELKPHGMSSTSWVWVSGADYSEGEPQMQQFAVKFKSKEIADEFKRVFQSCQQIIKKYLMDNDMQKPDLESSHEAVKPERKSKSEEQIEPKDKTKSETDTASDKETEPKKEDQFAPSTLSSIAKLHEDDTKVVVSSSSSSFAASSLDDSTCSSSNATKVQSTLEIQSSGEPFSVPSFSFWPASTAPLFGGISFGATNGSMLMKSTFGGANNVDAKASESTTEQSAASQGPTAVKPFGIFGAKGDLSECDKCIVQNDEEKANYVSDGANNLSSKSAAPILVGSSQGSSVSKSFGKFKVKEGSWECQACMLPNDKDKDKCISCGADNPSVESAAPKLAGSSQGSSVSKSFGKFKVKEGSWECQICMLPNDKDKDQCISCGADNPSAESAAPKLAGSSQGSSVSKSFGKFKVKEGSWECQACMLPNDKDKDQCISCGADNPSVESAAPKLAGSSQGSSVSKSFGKFKVKEGSWECQICMLPNDKDKDQCISCGADNPSAESSSHPVPAIEQNSSDFMFGNQPSFSFPNNANPAPFANPSFSVPLFSMGSASSGRTEDATQDAKHNFAFKPPSFSFQDSKQAGSVESSSSNSSIALKEEKPPAGLFGMSGGLGSEISMSGAPFRAAAQPNDGILGNLWSATAGPFKFGDSDVGIKATNYSNAETGEILNPVRNIFATPKSEAVSVSSVQPVAAHSHSMTNVIIPKSPESPSKEGGILCNPLVSLQRLDNLKTGEEKEIVVFSEKAKLYRYDANGKEWKERGVGELKILQKRDALNTYRLVMRRDQIRKLCANHFLVPGMVLKGMPNSEKMKIWTTTADFADEEAKKETFAVRFKSLDILEAFESTFNQATITESNEQQSAKCESSKSKVNDRSREDYSKSEEEKGVKQERGAVESKIAAEEKRAEEYKGTEEDKRSENDNGAKENKGAENDKGTKENKGNTKGYKETEQDKRVEEEEEEARVEEVDVEVTGVLLPSAADQDKAEKLLLPKEFFNKSNTSVTDDTIDLSMSTFK